jgi:hypothetical protein
MKTQFDGVVIVDLDGCLSDDRWRRQWLPAPGSPQSDYNVYHAQCGADRMVENVLDHVLYDAYDEQGAQRSLVLVVTARPDVGRIREDTIRWCKNVFTNTEFEVLMRPVGCTATSPELKVRLVEEFFHSNTAWGRESGWHHVVQAYDDRQDVLDAYPLPDSAKQCMPVGPPPEEAREYTAADVLRSQAATFEERNKVYANNYTRVPRVMAALWPYGVPAELVTSDARWHLFELIIVKLTRFANSGLSHEDSIHDAAVYAAMIEAELHKQGGVV